MSLGKQPGQTPVLFKDSETEENTIQLEVADSTKLSSLALKCSTLNLLDTSINIKKSNLSNSTEAMSHNDSKGLCTTIKTEKIVPVISLNEVSCHDTVDDCWLVISDYVYNCTDFVHNHPGSPEVLLEYAGRDATLAFIGTGHSQHAKNLLKTFLIGELPVSERIFRTQNGIKIGDFV